MPNAYTIIRLNSQMNHWLTTGSHSLYEYEYSLAIDEYIQRMKNSDQTFPNKFMRCFLCGLFNAVFAMRSYLCGL